MTAAMDQSRFQAVKEQLHGCGYGLLYQRNGDGFEYILHRWAYSRVCPDLASVEALARKLTMYTAAHRADD